MLHARNGSVELPTGTQDYIRFGNGAKTMIMLPGVGEGLKTVKGMALPFALLYRSLAKDFTVYVFSRRRVLSPGMTTRDMAEDLNGAMEAQGLSKAAIVGVSQGGMIAQWLALDHPDKGERLVLVVTLSRPNDVIKDVISRWLQMADQGDYKGIMLDTAERSYSPKRLKQSRLEYGLLGSIGKPKSFDRFRIQAASCLTHDTYDLLDQISCQTLVIGGKEDQIVTGQASAEIADKAHGEVYICKDYGHAAYDTAPDYRKRLLNFFLS